MRIELLIGLVMIGAAGYLATTPSMIPLGVTCYYGDPYDPYSETICTATEWYTTTVTDYRGITTTSTMTSVVFLSLTYTSTATITTTVGGTTVTSTIGGVTVTTTVGGTPIVITVTTTMLSTSVSTVTSVITTGASMTTSVVTTTSNVVSVTTIKEGTVFTYTTTETARPEDISLTAKLLPMGLGTAGGAVLILALRKQRS